ncbi:hypothetical protein GCM10027589_20950 [Actinocorallia lasiicapitis]
MPPAHDDPGSAATQDAAVATAAYLVNSEGDVEAAHRMLLISRFGPAPPRYLTVLSGQEPPAG